MCDEKVPVEVKEALSCKNKNKWNDAMRAEINALEKNKTWELVDLPKEHKAIGSKWVFALKRNKDGLVDRFKARLVAKVCSQVYGVNYKETFSPVVRHATIRTLLAIAVQEEMHLHQVDINTAYLISELNDVVYMKQPEHFENHSEPKKFLRLKKFIYGLRQCGRKWNVKLDNVIQGLGLHPCENEPCLYKGNVNSKRMLVAVYVDDLI